MTDSASRLRDLGIPPIDGYLQPQAKAECIRIGRRLIKEDKGVVGLWPAGPKAAAPPLGIQLSLALIELTRSAVAFVDANVRHPTFPQVAGVAETSNDQPGPRLFSEHWIAPSLAVLSPRSAPDAGAGAGVPQLEVIIARYREEFAYLLVDLTGFDALGDHLSAAALLDGVIIVARVGMSRERDLLRIKADLPESLNLGVVLTG